MAFISTTFTAGEQPTAAKWNQLQGNDDYLKAITDQKDYCFHATMSADQTGVTDNATTIVNFNTETLDPNNNYNTGTFGYTIPVTGLYQFTVAVNFSQTTLANITIGLDIDAVNTPINSIEGVSAIIANASYIGLLTAGQVVKANARLDVTSGTGTYEADNSFFAGYLIRAS